MVEDKSVALRNGTMAIALRYKGVHETTENWGPEVKRFLAAAKLKAPAPWCAAFVNCSAEEAAKALSIVSPLEAVPLQAYVQSYADYGKKKGWAAKTPQPGDLFCLWYPKLGRYGHIGIVTEVHATKKTFGTIEGNTDDDGSREGDSVWTKTRPITPNVLFLRYTVA